MVSRTIVAVQHTTLDEFPYFYLFIYFFLPEGIIAFSQNRKDKTTQVKAQLCMHCLSVPYYICKRNGAHQMENNAQR